MLKLLIQYDKKLITKEEFEQKKIDLLLEEQQLIRNEGLESLPVFHPISPKEEKKVQADTVNTILSLRTIGVPADKIRVVFNKVDNDDDLTDEFAAIFALGQIKKECRVSTGAAIFNNEVFERLKAVQKSLGDLSEDETDYRAKMKAATSEDEKQDAVTMIALQRLSKTANRNLDKVFEELTK